MGPPLAFIAGSGLLLGTAILIPAALRIRGRAPFLLGALVVASAAVVIGVIALSPFHLVTRSGLLVAQALLFGVSIGIWVAAGRPRPPGGWRPRPIGLVRSGRRHPAVAILLAAAGFAVALQLVMALSVAPNNWDSMTYHLSRAAYWLQQGSVEYFAGGSLRQLASPPNAEMIQLWTMALADTDRFAQLPQWLALIGTGVAIFSAARLLGCLTPAAAFAAALFVVMPQPVLQAASAQNDLVATFFIAVVAFFGVRGLRDRAFGDLALAGVALGLAVGTKGTAVFAGPSLLALAIGAAIAYRPPLRVLALGATFALAGFVLFGAFGYALNYAATGDPLGGLGTAVGRATPLAPNLVAVGLTFLDAPGTPMPWLDLTLSRALTAVGVLPAFATSAALDTSIQEDTSAFGLLGLLLLPPAVLVGLLGRRAPTGARLLALAALGYVAVFVVAAEQNAWIGRLLIPAVALAAPLVALVASSSAVRAIAVFVAILGLLPCLLVNPQKPFITPPGGAPSVLKMDRINQQTLIRPEMLGVLQALEDRTRPDEPLGFVGAEDSWDYPLFGPRQDRRVVRLRPEDVDGNRMRRERLGAVFFANVGAPPSHLRAEQLGPEYFLVRPPG